MAFLFTAVVFECALGGRPAPWGSTEIALAGSHDFMLSGGAQVEANQLLNVRSGSPHSKATAALAATLVRGATITSLQLTYKYGVQKNPQHTLSLSHTERWIAIERDRKQSLRRGG